MRFLRPPGAAPERDFLARCLQCGQCAQVCPYDSILLSTGFNLLVAGTPMVIPKREPCRLCMRCPPVCPSGALKELDIKKVRMGRAKIHRRRCYTYIGSVICRSCFENCLLKGRAIKLAQGYLPVITEDCAGCGICEHVCPAKCISTKPHRLMGLDVKPRARPWEAS